MIGHRVRILRERGEPIEGTLKSLKSEGATISPDGYGYPPPENKFIPMRLIIEIIDKGPVYR